MSETKKRNTHLPEFKAKAGLEAVCGAKTLNQIGQWKREIQVQAKTLFEGKRGPQAIAAPRIDFTGRTGGSRWSSIGSKKSGIRLP